MEESPMTPREAYEKYMNGENVETGKKVNVDFAKRILRRQAGRLCAEECVSDVFFCHGEDNPWYASVFFYEGKLSHDGQVILSAMRNNAHKTDIAEHDGVTQITFYVYCMEE